MTDSWSDHLLELPVRSEVEVTPAAAGAGCRITSPACQEDLLSVENLFICWEERKEKRQLQKMRHKKL